MLRFLFLILVVIGSLAVCLAVIFGIGVARHVAVNAPAVVAAPAAAPSTRPATTAPSTSPASRPASPPIVAVPPPVPPPPPAVPATVSLPAADADLKGNEIQLEKDDVATIGAWRRVHDYVVWKTAVPAKGNYRIDLLYSCENGSGGEFVLKAGASKFVMQTPGTGGWGNFKWTTIGTTRLSGKVTVAIKPSDLPEGHALMRLREVRLVPMADGQP